MEPTLQTNNVLATERISKRILNFERGDIVVARSPISPEHFVCKRIVGLPGDKIHMKPRYSFNPFGSTKSNITSGAEADDNEKDKIVTAIDMIEDIDDFDGSNKSDHINNQNSTSRVLRSKMVFVPRGHVWLEGDNSENSIDSRYYGPVPMGLIQSRVVCRIFPFTQMALF